MNCSSFKIQFSAYLDGELSGDAFAEIEAHLEKCAGCSGMLQAYRSGVSSLKRSVEIEPPADMFERVMAEVNSGAQAAKVVPLRSSGRRIVLAAAAVVLIALAGSLFFTGGDRVDVSWTPAVDSTVDVVNADEIQLHPAPEAGKLKRPVQKAYLASYHYDDEPLFSYGVSNHPVIVESGVTATGE
ncbi:MAG: hypothetical protein FVQ81_11810 [Candidatus Glassbacteria bacterium]|nr:hypothetical protein [Candidatus Glassbacteria bacterium]